MVDDTLTVPCEGIGVWDGARVVHTDGRVGVVVATGELAGQPGAWAAFGAGINSVPEPGFHLARDLRLDLTHRPTRLEALVLLAERSGLGRAGGGGGPRWLRAEWVSETCWACDAGTSGGWDARDIPALGEIDRADDTRLPGGARVVDVRALAVVLRQVFTPPQPPPPQPR